jgi:DNA-binding CsgD family transcriptional regulator
MVIKAVGRMPLRGRDVPLHEARRLLDKVVAERTAAAITVLGDRGIGKTSFLHAVASDAEHRGFSVGLGTGAHTVSTPMATMYSALRSGSVPLLSQERFDELGQLQERQLWLVDRLAALLESLAVSGPLLVAFDDVHLADPLSVFTLRILSGRLARLPVVWLFAGDQTPDGSLSVIADSIGGEVRLSTIRLQPLTDTAIYDLAADHVDGKIHPALRTQLVGTAGFPWLAVALLDGLTDHGGHSTDQLVRSVGARLSALPPPARRLAVAGAVLGSAFTADEAAHMLGGQAGETVIPWIDALVDARILDDDGDRLSFRADLFRQGVYAAITPTPRKAMHRAAAETVMRFGGDPLRAAPHLLVSAMPGDSEAPPILTGAARELAHDHPDRAANLISKAFELLAVDDPAWIETGTFAVSSLVRARRPQAAIEIADRLLAVRPETDAVIRIESLLVWPLWSLGRLGSRQASIEYALDHQLPSERDRARLEALLALVLTPAPDLDSVRESINALLADARQQGDEESEATALWVLGEIEVNDGRNVAAAGRFRDLKQMMGASWLAEAPVAYAFDRVEHNEDGFLEHGEPGPGSGEALSMEYTQMWQSVWRGELEPAEVSARNVARASSARQEHLLTCEAYTLLCRIAFLRGDVDGAARALADAENLPLIGEPTREMLVLTMRSWVAELSGDEELSRGCTKELTAVPHTLRHRIQWQPSWLMRMARIGRAYGEDELIRQALASSAAFAERNPDDLVARAVSLHVTGMAREDPEPLAGAVEMLRAASRPVVLIEVMTDYGQVLMHSGDRDRAVAALKEASELAQKIGATGELQRIQRVFRAAGIRRRAPSPARPEAGWAALTEAERRVAYLIADGHSNKSAAAELFLSPSTVATHLHAVYGKTGVTSRLQLANLVAENQ